MLIAANRSRSTGTWEAMPPGKCDEGVAEGAGRAENTFVPWRRQRGAAAAGVAPHFLHCFAPKLSY
mgnify:CR=1 FL=1